MADQKEEGPFAGFLRLLAKLGILRYGTKSYVYTSGRDRPAESLMPGVFNAERDLTTLQDIKTVLGRKDAARKPKK
jgi:hypothetical protein